MEDVLQALMEKYTKGIRSVINTVRDDNYVHINIIAKLVLKSCARDP